MTKHLETELETEQELTKITKYVQSTKSIEAVSPAVVRTIADTITTFATADSITHLNRALLGKFYHKFLEFDLSIQEEFVSKWAAAIGVQPPSYPAQDGKRQRGRPTSGRKQLVAMVYAGQPRMVAIPKGHFDSLGGKSVTAAIRDYLQSVGKLKKPPKARLRAQRMKATISLLFAEANQKERAILNQLAIRAGVPPAMLDKWEQVWLTNKSTKEAAVTA